MVNGKLDGATWISDTRADQINTYTETYTPEGETEQTAEYKLVETHPIIGGVLDKLAFLRTHASAVWYNKLAGITVLQKLDNLASNIGTLASLLTTDKTSLVAAVNELNGKIGYAGGYKVIDVSVADINNPPLAFILRTSVKPVGFPPKLGGNSCTVIQCNPGNNEFSAQIAFSFVNDSIAIRHIYGNGGWSEWKYFSSAS